MANQKVKKNKQRSTKHAHKAKDRVTRTPLKTEVSSGVPDGWVLAPVVAPSCYSSYKLSFTYNAYVFIIMQATHLFFAMCLITEQQACT